MSTAPPPKFVFTTGFRSVVESSLAVGHELVVKWHGVPFVYRVVSTRVHVNRRYMDVEVEYDRDPNN